MGVDVRKAASNRLLSEWTLSGRRADRGTPLGPATGVTPRRPYWSRPACSAFFWTGTALTPNSYKESSIIGHGHVSRVHGHHPRLQGVLTERPSSGRLLPSLEFQRQFPGHVLRCAVIRVRCIRTVRAGELVAVAVFFDCTPTLRALLAGAGWLYLLDHDASQFGPVFGLFLQFTERPLLELFAVAETLSDLLQVLERDVRTAMSVDLL
jgi:hypothetical protein